MSRVSFRQLLGLRPDDSRHGTTNGYWNYGCRCRPCTDAASAYNRAWRERNREKNRTYQREWWREKRKNQPPPGSEG